MEGFVAAQNEAKDRDAEMQQEMQAPVVNEWEMLSEEAEEQPADEETTPPPPIMAKETIVFTKKHFSGSCSLFKTFQSCVMVSLDVKQLSHFTVTACCVKMHVTKGMFANGHGSFEVGKSFILFAVSF